MKRPQFGQLLFWIGAGLVGLAAISYAQAVKVVQGWFFEIYAGHPLILSSLTPVFFLCAAAIVVKVAPEAKGSGIPQVLEAIRLARPGERLVTPLVSLRTAFIKVISSLTGLLGGASIGREGPTVQIAASVFGWLGNRARKISPQSYLIAGAAAGVAAAFNTPLAGITFALEEIAEEGFHHFKQNVVLAVVLAGIVTQSVLGDYLYFGRYLSSMQPGTSGGVVLLMALLLGGVGGIFGTAFAWLISRRQFRGLPTSWWKRALICGVICGAIGYFSDGQTAGSGYEVVRKFIDSPNGSLPLLFGPAKFVTTIISYLSGMAGGIFSPCLSIGSGLGYAVGKLLHFPDVKLCVLLGMVAFFSGVVQAPLTAVIIVMEMTDAHILILPFMVSAFLAQRLARIFMPVPVYRRMAEGMHAG